MALLAGCAILVRLAVSNGCADHGASAGCPAPAYTMVGSQCYSVYYTVVDDDAGFSCKRDTTLQNSLIPCQGDSSTPSAGAASVLHAFLRHLLPRIGEASPYPANQMQTYRATSTGSLPFDLAKTVLDLPFQPLYAGTAADVAGDINCDSTVTVLSAGYTRGTVIPSNPCNLTVGTPIQTGQGSLEIALTPDGKVAFVTNYNGSVAVIDTNLMSVVSTIQTPGANPFGIAISPDGTTAWVASYNSASPALLVINVATRTLTSTTPLSVAPQNLFVSPDGSLLWITSQLANNITILDTLTLMPSATITSIALPTGIAFNPTGTVAYVASATSPGAVQAVNTQDYSLGTSYQVGNEPVDLKMSDSTWLTVMNRSSDFLSEINVMSGQVNSDPVNLIPNSTHTGLAFVQ